MGVQQGASQAGCVCRLRGYCSGFCLGPEVDPEKSWSYFEPNFANYQLGPEWPVAKAAVALTPANGVILAIGDVYTMGADHSARTKATGRSAALYFLHAE